MRPVRQKSHALFAAVSLSVCLGGCGDRAPSGPLDPEAQEAEFWSRVDAISRRTGARDVSVTELRAFESRPLLLDVRTPAEFAAGHLAGAIRVDPGTAPKRIAGLPQRKDAPIVAYCTVGQRSGDLVRGLAASGYTNARNLRGGIIAWANTGAPLESSGDGPPKVHAWSREWARYLRPVAGSQ